MLFILLGSIQHPNKRNKLHLTTPNTIQFETSKYLHKQNIKRMDELQSLHYRVPRKWTIKIHTRTQKNKSLYIHKTPTQNTYTKQLHKTPTQNTYTKHLHITSTQNTYTKHIHITHTQNTYTKYIHKTHTQNTYTKYIHNIHTIHYYHNHLQSRSDNWAKK